MTVRGQQNNTQQIKKHSNICIQGQPNLRVSPFHLRKPVLISFDEQVGQHGQAAICPSSSPIRHDYGHLTLQTHQMHLGLLLEALMSYSLHYYHNRQDVHRLHQFVWQIVHDVDTFTQGPFRDSM